MTTPTSKERTADYTIQGREIEALSEIIIVIAFTPEGSFCHHLNNEKITKSATARKNKFFKLLGIDSAQNLLGLRVDI